MKTIFRPIFIISFLSALGACQEVEQPQLLQLENISYTFDYKGGERHGIIVHSNCEWDAHPEADWIGITERVEDTLFITVRENEADAMRKGEVVFESGNVRDVFHVEQLGRSFRGKCYNLENYRERVVLSRNGKYIAGMRRVGRTFGRFLPVITDTETGKETILEEQNRNNTFKFISNDGKLICIGKTEAANSLLFPVENGQMGEEIHLRLPDGFDHARYEDISADGSVIVGYAKDMNKNGKFTPMKWTHGEPEVLEQPKENLAGSVISIGSMIRGCSDDGNICYGSEWGTFGVIAWVGNEMTFVGALPGFNEVESHSGERPKFSGLIKTAEPNGISPNGKYIAMTYRNLKGEQFPAMVDTETMEVTVLEELDGLGMTCSDDGILFAGSPSMMGCTKSFVGVQESSEYRSVTEWFKETYGVDMEDNHMVYMISDNYVFGYKAFVSYMTGHIVMTYYCFIPEK